MLCYKYVMDGGKRGENMNQQEKQIIKNIVAVFPMLDESNKKYLLGLSEGMVLVRKQENAS